ncbi:MAG: NUDIX hydrolase [Chromatiales bacterium]
MIENARSEILLLRRSTHARLGPGRWGFPAGHVDPGETPLACSRRELREEIGRRYRVELLRRHEPVRDTFYGGRYEIHLFHYLWIDGEIALNCEHTAFAWVSCGRYPEFEVMDGIDEDLAYLDIWPRRCLNQDRLPAHLRS